MQKSKILLIVLLIVLLFLILYTILYTILSKNKDNFEYENPIDVVITWVDSQEENWKSQLEYYKNKPLEKARFPDPEYPPHTELNVCVKSILKFAPWVRRIWIVTQRPQVPKLDLDQKYINKIGIVHHDEIFDNIENLPVFNSHAIETSIHKIPGLSEKFIYLNDDVYFTSYTNPKHFFTDDGKPIMRLKKILKPLVVNSEHIAAWKTIMKMYKSNYKTVHVGVPLTKTICYNCENKHKDMYTKTSKNRFRTYEDIPPIGLTVLYSISNKLCIINPKDDFSYSVNYRGKDQELPKTTMFCMNVLNKKVLDEIEDYIDSI